MPGMAVRLNALGAGFDGGGPDGPIPEPGRHLPLDSAYSNCFWGDLGFWDWADREESSPVLARVHLLVFRPTSLATFEQVPFRP